MGTKNNGSEYFLLRPLGRLCGVVAFKLNRISTEGTDEVRMIQKKKTVNKGTKQQVSHVAEYIGAAREKAYSGHIMGHTGEGAHPLGILAGHERLGRKSKEEGKISEDIKISKERPF